MEVSPSLKKLWNEWQLQTLVLLSLTLQIILLLLGNRRRYINKIWIKMIVWPAYLMADFIATSALGLLTNRFVYHSGPLYAKLELTAFWAPLLLLHLGGPDTITAYALEDNQLWSRHLLQLVGQTGLALYVVFAGWTGSRVSFLTIPIMLAGLIKYGERTWALWSANCEQHRVSTSSYHNKLQALSDVQDYSNLSDDKLLQLAYGMFDMAKLLFAGVPITTKEQSALANYQEAITTLLRSPKDSFKVIEMQLGLLYDMLYTKALVTYTPCGIGLRFISFLLTSIVLLLFSLEPNNTQTYSKVDLRITFLLLAVAIVLELYAILVLLLSDSTVVWLRKHSFSNISVAITSHPLLGNLRWSNSMGQFNLLSYVLNEKAMDFHGIQKFLTVNEKLERRWNASYRQVSDDLKKQLVELTKSFHDLLKKRAGEKSIAAFGTLVSTSLRGVAMFQETSYPGMGFIVMLSAFIDFQQTIIVWHIATELCYYQDYCYFNQKNAEGMDENNDVVLNRKTSKRISRYMMYLLAISPEMLPASGAVGQVNFKRTCEEAREEIESFKPQVEDKVGTQKERKSKIKIGASKYLFARKKDSISSNEEEILGQLNGSLLSLACKLAELLIKIQEGDEEPKSMERKWEAIAGCWFEFLLYAGKKCSGSQHAQRLRQGGEFLTHFWLLYEELTSLGKLDASDV